MRKVGRPRKWKNDAERKRAWYQRQKLKKGQLIETPRFIEEPEFIPELVDTRTWTWEKFARVMLGIILTPFQIVVLRILSLYMRIILPLPRGHGKTTIILRVFCTRKLCESVYEKKDINICYISSSKDNIIDFVLLVAADLLENEKILENYGNLLDVPSKREVAKLLRIKPKSRRQTQVILNLGHRKDLFNPSLFGTTIKGAFRGKGFHYNFIDDPVDIFHVISPTTARKLTKKIKHYIYTKLYPRALINISVVGTRYDTDGHDIFTLLAQELGGAVWKYIDEFRRAITVFGDYRVRDTIHEINPSDMIIDKPEEWELLSPFIWEKKALELLESGIQCTGLQYAVYMYWSMDRPFFMQEFQNEVMALESRLNYELLNDYTVLPAGDMKWGIFCDLSSGESKLSDYTGITLVGRQFQNFYIHDIIWGRWTGLQKQKQLESFVQKGENELNIDHRNISTQIETVKSQRDFFQRIRDESWISPKPRSPAGRGEKEHRITHGLGQEMENSKVFIFVNCRNKSRLRSEMSGFPGGEHEHVIDSIDQNIFFLKKEKELPFSGRTSRKFTKRKE